MDVKFVMKALRSWIVAVAAIIAPVYAADAANPIKFRTPMAFLAGGVTLPAGEYSVVAEPAGPSGGLVLTIQSAKGAKAKATAERVSTPDGGATPTTIAKLERDGQSMRLTALWVAGETTGFRIVAAPAQSAE